MPNVLSSLMVTLGADTAAFQQDMGKAGQTAKTEFEKITDSAKAMGAALAAAFTLDAIKDGVLQAVDFADAMGDMAARTGQSVESLTAMGYAAQFSGTSIDTYSAGIEKLSNNIISAVQGNDTALKMFNQLGVSVTDAGGKIRDSQSVLLDLADKISAIQSPAEKTAVVMDVFGKSAGPELLQLLNQGSSGITALTTEAQRMGAVISTETANQAGAFNDALDRAHIAANGLYMTIAKEVLPTLNNFSDRATTAAVNGGVLEKSATALGVAFNTVYTGGAVLGNVLGFIGDQLGKVGAMAALVANGEFQQLKNIWNDRTGLEQYKSSILELGNIWNKVGSSTDNAAKAQERAISFQPTLGANTDKKKGRASDNFQYGGLANSAVELNNADTAYEISSVQYIANEKLRIEKETEEKRREELIYSAAQLEYLKGKQLADERELQEAKRQEISMTKDFFLNGLDQMAQGHGKAAKAAQAVQRAQALYQIGVNTYSAAMGAYNALAPIPIVGPALGVAAAAAAIAFGGQMMAGVNSGGKPSAPGAPSLPSASGGSANVQPVSMQQPERTQQTILQIPANSLMTGRMIADLLDEALGDGKQLTNLRVQAV